MQRDITIQARRDDEANVWLATSEDVPGPVVEADTWPAMINEAQLVLPELLELSAARDEVSSNRENHARRSRCPHPVVPARDLLR